MFFPLAGTRLIACDTCLKLNLMRSTFLVIRHLKVAMTLRFTPIQEQKDIVLKMPIHWQPSRSWKSSLVFQHPNPWLRPVLIEVLERNGRRYMACMACGPTWRGCFLKIQRKGVWHRTALMIGMGVNVECSCIQTLRGCKLIYGAPVCKPFSKQMSKKLVFPPACRIHVQDIDLRAPLWEGNKNNQHRGKAKIVESQAELVGMYSLSSLFWYLLRSFIPVFLVRKSQQLSGFHWKIRNNSYVFWGWQW